MAERVEFAPDGMVKFRVHSFVDVTTRIVDVQQDAALDPPNGDVCMRSFEAPLAVAERETTHMNICGRIAVLAFLLGGCEQKDRKPEVAPSSTATSPSVAKTPEPAPVASKPVANERRANGPGFTVALPPSWEPRTQAPNMFGANRGPAITLQISAPAKDPIRANYLAAARDVAACDAVFRSLTGEMQMEFAPTKNTGCERETSVVGRTMLTMVGAVDDRPVFAMCGGEGDRASWEPECRAIVGSLRWDANASAAPPQQSSAKTETLANGSTRVHAGGIDATLVPGWSLRPDVPDVKFTAMREKGFGVLTVSAIDGAANITSAADCRDRASTFASDGGELTSSKLEGGRCSFTMTVQEQSAEMVLAPGNHGDTLALACMWGAKDKQVASECATMLAGIVDRRAAR